MRFVFDWRTGSRVCRSAWPTPAVSTGGHGPKLLSANAGILATLILATVTTNAAAPDASAIGQLTTQFAPDDPGCALLIRSQGQVKLASGYGVRDLRSQATIDTSTDFRLASLTKQFTAMAVMLLVHDGRLSYDATLGELLPGFPGYAQRITVRHLLTHTSGIADYEELMQTHGAQAPYSPTQQIQDHEVLALLRTQAAPMFVAGDRWAYSNSGYVLLGLIVARVSGQPFGDYLNERIFRPLGMRHTVLFQAGQNSVSRRAFGHVRSGDRFVVSDQSSTSATQGDGGIYSNIDDLARWDAALEEHALLPASAMQAALTPVTLEQGREARWPELPDEDNLAPGQPVAYGFGWFLDPYMGHDRMWHFGTTEGFRTAIMRFPADRLTVAVLCNRTDVDAIALARRLADAYLRR
jgi:CubicO group peptidase (beta-lactamase class C family)